MKKLSTLLMLAGIIFVLLGVALFILIFQPIVTQEVNYAMSSRITTLEPVDKEFGIVIQKIGASAKIIPAVDPYDSNEYQWALTKGVAQAKGTANPDTNGNMFLFSHSSNNFYEARRYNSIFYLLSKLEKGDTIEIYFKKEKYLYTVTEKKIVAATEVSYMHNKSIDRTLTLMTCWPAGTSFKRLLVNAKFEK